jgi:hypothetical protein
MWVTAQIEDKPISPAELERDRKARLAAALAHAGKGKSLSNRQLDKMVDRLEEIVIQLRQQDELQRLQGVT